MSADTINKTDYLFVDGAEYTLPDDNEKVKRMIRQKALILKTEKPADDKTPDKAKAETKKGVKK